MERRDYDPESREPQGRGTNGFYPRKCRPGEDALKDHDYNIPAYREYLRKTGYWMPERDWRKTGPLAKLWRLPEPFRTISLSAVLAVGIPAAIVCAARYFSYRSPRGRRR